MKVEGGWMRAWLGGKGASGERIAIGEEGVKAARW